MKGKLKSIDSLLNLQGQYALIPIICNQGIIGSFLLFKFTKIGKKEMQPKIA